MGTTTTTIKMLRDGTPVASTTEGREIVAADLEPGMRKWSEGIAAWQDVDAVSGPDRWGKMNLVLNGSGCRIRADAAVRVR